MKKLLLTLVVIATVTGGMWLIRQKDAHQARPQTSGALEALQFLGTIQTYPSGDIPAQAQYAAWLRAKRMPLASEAGYRTAPWESMGPHNRGGRMLSLTFNPLRPATLYAGSASGGLWRSYTGGEGALAWHRVETGFPVLGVSCIAFPPADSNLIFIGTGEVYNLAAVGTGAAYRNTRGSVGIGILRSTDGGQTWHKSLDFTMSQEKGVWDIVVAPSAPHIVYAATTDGVYKSMNAGESWTLVLDVPMATDLVVHPDDANKVVVVCGNFESPGHGLYRTTNGGVFWHKVISQGLPASYRGKAQLAMAPSDPDILYASFGDGFLTSEGASWLCRSLDFGASWEIRSTVDYSKWQGWFSHDVAVSPDDPNEIVVVGIEVWRSENGGLTLSQTSVGGTGYSNPPPEGPDGLPNYVHSDAHDVIFHPIYPDVLYICSDGGIHQSFDGGFTFASRNGGLQTAQFYNGFSTSPTDPVFCMGGLQDNNTIRWNGDLTWTRFGGGDGSWTAIHPTNDDIFFYSSQYLSVRRTTDGGANFSSLTIPASSPVAFIAPYVVSPAFGAYMYAGSAIVARSTDGGSNWTVTNSGAPLDGNPALSMAASHQNPLRVYVATAPFGGRRSHVFVTHDGGDSWNDITGTLPDRFPMDLAVDPTDDAVAYVTWSGYGVGHLWRTNDYGQTWEDIGQDLPDVPTNAVIVDPLFPNNIYVGNDIGVFASTDYGHTWMNYSEGFTDAVMVFDLQISPVTRKLIAATHGSGAFQRDLLELPLSTSAVGLPLPAVELWPNPAVTQLQVRIHGTALDQCRFSVVNEAGRTCHQFEGVHFSEGEKTWRLDVQDWEPGVYFFVVSKQGRSRSLPFVVSK